MCEPEGWPDNTSFQNIAVNFSDYPLQARVHVNWPDLGGGIWRLTDMFSGEQYERQGDELARSGLYVGLGPWGYHFLCCSRR